MHAMTQSRPQLPSRDFAVRTLVRMAVQRNGASTEDARRAESMAIKAMRQGGSAAMAVAQSCRWLRERAA